MALALTSRRSWLAATASILAAMALAAAVAGRSCRVSQPGPEAAVRDMLQAAKSGDPEAVYELLGPATRARLDVEARRATERAGAGTRVNVMSLVSLSTAEMPPPSDITVVAEHGDHATVEIVSPTGRSRMDLVRADGRWLVEVELRSVD